MTDQPGGVLCQGFGCGRCPARQTVGTPEERAPLAGNRMDAWAGGRLADGLRGMAQPPFIEGQNRSRQCAREVVHAAVQATVGMVMGETDVPRGRSRVGFHSSHCCILTRVASGPPATVARKNSAAREAEKGAAVAAIWVLLTVGTGPPPMALSSAAAREATDPA